MSFALNILTILIVLSSLGFCLVSTKLLYRYIQAYQFEESQYTLLLGFVRLRWITWAYLLGVLIIGAFAFFMTFFLEY